MPIDGLRAFLLRHTATRAVYRLLDNLDRHNATLAAGAIAFDAFLSLVPLAALAGYAIGYLHRTGDLVLKPILEAAPVPVQKLVFDTIAGLSQPSGESLATLAPVSLVLFLWVSSSGVSTAMSVFETVFHSRPRPWWRRRLISMLSVLAGIASITTVAAIAYLFVSISGSLGARAVAFVVPGLTIVGALAAFFRVAIRGPRPLRRRVLPGAVTTVALWFATSALFSYYVTTLSRYTTLYGGLAAVAIFLLWLWLLALALLVGGEVNAQLEGIRDESTATPLPSQRSDSSVPSGSPPTAPKPQRSLPGS